MDKYNVAITAFKLEYNALPGDMDNAYDYWGANCDSTASNCNGNDNGLVEEGNGTNDSEVNRAWQHLSLAHLIPGSYAGVLATYGNVTLGTDFPKGSLNNTGYAILTSSWWGMTRNHFEVGAPNAGQYTVGAAINGPDAINIDNKIDDGSKNTGTVWSVEGVGAGGSCNEADTVKSCRMNFDITASNK